MVDQKLVEFIENFVHKGGSFEQATDKLLSVGHKKEDVHEAASKVKRKRFEEIGAIVLGVIIIIGLIGLFVNKLGDKQPVVEEPKSSYVLLSEAIASGDISACDQFNPVKKNLCQKSILGELGDNNPATPPTYMSVIEQAIANNDSSLCENLSVVQKDRCLILTGAKKAEEPKIVFDPVTNQTKTEQQVFKDTIAEAVELGDTAICDQISNPVERQFCYARLS
ncbi:MAG: hypothetical protein KKF65_01350 [Nanoarchaeota archaeon]|nr:hypothetical protein [Nanoarchaeota archaeon]